MKKFKQEVIDKMLTDPDLFSAICKLKKALPSNLAITIRRNGNSINQYAIVKLVAEYLDVEADSLVEDSKIQQEAA